MRDSGREVFVLARIGKKKGRTVRVNGAGNAVCDFDVQFGDGIF